MWLQEVAGADHLRATHQMVSPSPTLSPFCTRYIYGVFCEQGAFNNNPLHKVATENAVQALKETVPNGGYEKFRVKLCAAINPEDTHAIDIWYHKSC